MARKVVHRRPLVKAEQPHILCTWQIAEVARPSRVIHSIHRTY